MAAAGWYPDPTGRFELRWFDGTTWSPSVSRGGQQFLDDPSAAPTAPAPTPAPGFGPPPGFGRSPIPMTESEPASSGANVGLIVGAIVLVVALVAVGAVLLLRSSKDSTVTSGGTTPASVAGGSTTPASVSGTGIGSQPVDVSGDALPNFDPSVADPAVGTKAPVLQGIDLSGNPITVDAATDGPYMIVFLAHWCPHCNREIPRLINWSSSGAVPKNLKIIGVATAVGSSLPNYPPDQWLVAKEWPWPAMIDQSNGEGVSGVAADAFGASGWPYFVIVGADGLVKVRSAGEIQIPELQKMVDAALAS